MPKFSLGRLLALLGGSMFLASVAHAGVDAPLSTKLDRLLSTFADSGAIYVARVVEFSSGREIYLHNPDRAVAPASNAKLANVAAGLDRFGPDYLWRTYLAMDGDDLWIIGTGDPSCGDKRLEQAHGQKRLAILDDWADALIRRGVKHIKGKLIVDDGIFDDQWVGASWPKSELTDEWSAPLTGLSLNQNCIAVTAYPDRLDVLPRTQIVQLINKTRSTGKAEDLSIERAKGSNTFTVTGLAAKKEELDTKPIVDPGLFFADALRTKLKERGITIDGISERATRTSANAKWGKLKSADERDSRVVAVHETAMKDIVGRIDKQSQNLFADALCKLQGRAWDLDHGQDVPGNWKAGSETVHAFLRRMKIDDSQYVLVDGSGLSSDNRVTVRLISDVLIKMTAHPQGKVFRESLSICGKDGTLDDRMMDITGMVQGKSGTIDGVKALSGYLTTKGGGLLVFSMIFNNAPPQLEKRCQRLLDDACRVLADWPNIKQSTTAADGTRP